ncbi:cation diffusion facilitator family transporter [Rhodoplanes roseus]|uniref:Cation transporter n=1 Tax=Rhodoplanes roseus TaxID=29409 RepID=A0A327L7U2_9BRAD|nr:cation diffusion facilitator family transporter [Rhodoplanes roseus]RAI46135.1 cation transporter [Rhodoplanes roseus]
MHGGGSTGTAAAQHAGRLKWALGLTATYMFAEIVGGLVTGSLALLADAAHMMTDVGGLALALLAINFAAREATPQRTYGYLRMEVLSALTNAVVLLLLTVYILYEAYQRFQAPPEIRSGPMLVVAAIGLVVNLISMRLLAGGSSESLNVKGAYFEVLSDMLGSIGVIVASLLIMWKGWVLADPIIGASIGLFIVPRTWTLLKQVTHILMEGTPANVDLGILERKLMQIPGVTAVHDLHVWTVTSGFDAMSGHLVVADISAGREALRQARHIMKDDFGIDHVTIQVDDEVLRSEEALLHV